MLTEPTTTLADTQPIWWQAMSSPLGRWCLVVALLCAVGIAVGWVALRRLHAGGARFAGVRDEDGTATIEFTLVFPFLLFLMLSLAQVTMLMAGNMNVHYSAYAAARAAIVHVPRAFADDGPNEYTQGEGNTKHDLILEAAAIALTPFGGRLDSSYDAELADRYAEGLADYYAGEPVPRWTGDLAREKLNYCLENTEVTLGYPEVLDSDAIDRVQLQPGESHTYGHRDAITAYLTHKLYLGVPYVNRIFGEGRADGERGMYVQVKSDCTLTNEGMRDELPPLPTIPRTTPPY